MKVTFKKKALVDLFRVASAFHDSITVASKAALGAPILFEAYEAENGKPARVVLTCTEGGMLFEGYPDIISADFSDGGRTRFAIQLGLLDRMRMPGDMVILETPVKGAKAIDSGHVVVKSGRVRGKLRMSDPDIVVLDHVENTSGLDMYDVDAAVLVEGIRSVDFGARKEEPVGVRIQADGNFLVVSSNDSFKGAEFKIAQKAKPFSLMLPKQFASILVSNLYSDDGNMHIGADPLRVLIQTKRFKLVYPTLQIARTSDISAFANSMKMKDTPRLVFYVDNSQMARASDETGSIFGGDKGTIPSVSLRVVKGTPKKGKNKKNKFIDSIILQAKTNMGSVSSTVDGVWVKEDDVKDIMIHPGHLKEFVRLASTKDKVQKNRFTVQDNAVLLETRTFKGLFRTQQPA